VSGPFVFYFRENGMKMSMSMPSSG